MHYQAALSTYRFVARRNGCVDDLFHNIVISLLRCSTAGKESGWHGRMALWRTEGGRAYGYTQMGNNTSSSLVPSHSRFLLLSFYSTSAFLMKSLMNANTVYRHDCDPDWGQIKEGVLWWVAGRRRKAFAISLLHGHTAVMFPVFLPSLSCPVYRLLIKACRLVHLIRIHQRELGIKRWWMKKKGSLP